MTEHVSRARGYVYRNARLLERMQFACLFEGGDAESVVDALRPHQNPDGGFGNALEPDMRGPHSQPMHVDMAFRVLDDVGGFGDPMARRSFHWLQSIAAPDGGIPWVLPSVAEYPCAPWWQGGDPDKGSVGATASILHLALKNGVDHPIVPLGLGFLRDRLADPADDDLEFHQLRPAGEALSLTKEDGDRALLAKVSGLVKDCGLIASTEQARNEPYAHTPLHWAREPESAWRSLFADEDIERDLDALAKRQNEDGSWPLGFPLTSPAAEFEWKGRFTIEALQTLKAYGRIT